MEKARLGIWSAALVVGALSCFPLRAQETPAESPAGISPEATPQDSVFPGDSLVTVQPPAPQPVASFGGFSTDDLHVSGYMDAGRFQVARSDGPDGEIISRVGARWNIDKQLDENWSMLAELHWIFWRNQRTDLALFHVAGLKFDSDVQAALAYASGAQRTKVGLYDFKYNPDSRNLGEYLLRSEAYPTLVENSQGKDLLKDSYTKVAGVEYGREEGKLFRHKALLYAEQHANPVNDLNLVYLATFGPKDMEIGAGVAWHRFAKFGDKINNPGLDSGNEFASVGQYVAANELTTEAVKFSLRSRIDIASLTGLENSFVLYGEAALLGLQKDTLYYKNIVDRIPLMLGVSFGIPYVLNSLALEVEYFKNPYYDQRYLVQDATGGRFSPLPYLPTLDEYSNLPNYTRDDWKWSLTAERSIGRWIDFKVRVASDHMRLRNWDGDYEGGRPLTNVTFGQAEYSRNKKSDDEWYRVDRLLGDWYVLARIEFHN